MAKIVRSVLAAAVVIALICGPGDAFVVGVGRGLAPGRPVRATTSVSVLSKFVSRTCRVGAVRRLRVSYSRVFFFPLSQSRCNVSVPAARPIGCSLVASCVASPFPSRLARSRLCAFRMLTGVKPAHSHLGIAASWVAIYVLDRCCLVYHEHVGTSCGLRGAAAATRRARVFCSLVTDLVHSIIGRNCWMYV